MQSKKAKTGCPNSGVPCSEKHAIAQKCVNKKKGIFRNEALPSHWIRLKWPLIGMILLAVFFAYTIAFRDGITYFVLCLLAVGIIYAIFNGIIWGLSRYTNNHGFVRFLAFLSSVSIWATIVITFLIYPAISGTVKYRSIMKSMCHGQLRNIYDAMQQYHERYGSPVPRCTVDKDGKPLHSWRVLLLPFLEERKLYSELRLKEPWNSPHNLNVFHAHPEAANHFRCPTLEDDPNEKHPMDTSYIMLPQDGLKYQFEDSEEGDVDILIGEVKGSGIHWAEPRDRPAKSKDSSSNNMDEVKVGSDHGMANILLDNGKVRAVPSGKILLPSPDSKHDSPDVNEPQEHK